MTRVPTPTAADRERGLAQLSASNGGFFTRDEALRLGFTATAADKRVERGVWMVLCPGVLAPAGSAVGVVQMEAALHAWLGPRMLLSHLSAARRLEIPAPASGLAWITVRADDRLPRLEGVEVTRSRRFPPLAWVRAGLPVTPPARTVVDLAQVLDREGTASAMTHVLQRRSCALPQIVEAAAQVRGRGGSALARSVAAELCPGWESFLERRLGGAYRGAGITQLKSQLVIRDGAGRQVARCDFGNERLRLAVEADGWFYHGSRAQQQADRARDRKLLLLGWRTVRFTTEDIMRRLEGTVRETALLLDALAAAA